MSSGPQLHKYEREMDKLDARVNMQESILHNLDALFDAAVEDFTPH